MTKLESMLRVLKKRNFAGKNEDFNITCHPAVRSTFLGKLGMGRFGVDARRLSLMKSPTFIIF
ncbi:hypothetical protein NEUTE2DRAFT_53961 [Neurospora tetrasperma FGSC 2509]|nr:hypothetical protein NEUTE2DRAFT_53961 [Neurospora tetrasperma FGSC 2509]